MNKLRADLAEVAQALVEAGRAEAGEAKVRLQKMAQQRLDDVRRALDGAKQRSQDVADVLKEYAEEKPLTSLVIAFGAGMLLAALMRRR
jgi:ElaB/YqjD/DUF883 family membrane-anchored ribosome-binding protein